MDCSKRANALRHIIHFDYKFLITLGGSRFQPRHNLAEVLNTLSLL